MNIYKFKITNKRNKKIFKVLEVPGNMSLYCFAEKIIKTYGFYFDHAFCFTSDLENPYQQANKLFELSYDLEEEPTEGAMSVKKSFVTEAFKEVGNRMLFLFDYGDGWEFIIELLDNSEDVIRTTRNYFKLIESHDKDPEQYPDYE